jgi:hypothetical protein
MGEAVNSEADEWGEYGGFVDADESVLIFSSNRPGGFGEYDLYVSFRGRDGRWTRAANLGPRINDAGLQMWPVLSPDGKYLFYVHGPVVYWVDAGVLDEFRPPDIR